MEVTAARAWVRRINRLIISLVAVLTLSFLMIQLIPGDPVRTALGPDAPQELVLERTHQLGLDRNIFIQYINYWKNVFTGNLGDSIIYGTPISSMLAARAPNTLILVAMSMVATLVLALLGGVVVGIVTRSSRLTSLRLFFNMSTAWVGALPSFLLAPVFVYFFAMRAGWFPIAFASGYKWFVLPLAAIALGTIANLSRIVRSSTEKVLGEDYILVARSKRLPRRRIYFRHALPNLLTAALTIGGLQVGAAVTGTIVVEQVFAIPGLGQMLTTAIVQGDFPAAQICMLIFATSVLVVNLVVDILLVFFDPRAGREVGQS